MRALKLVLGIIVIVAAAFGGLYVTDRLMAAQDTEFSGGRPPGGGQVVQVETVQPQAQRFLESVRAVGTARARQALQLMPDAGGQIASIDFQPGDQVSAGDLLIQLDDRAEQAELKAAEATLAEAEAAFARQEQLNCSGSSSDAAYQTARAALLRAEADRDTARLALEDRSLRAPFSGVIGLTDLVEGQMIDTSTAIATLDDLSVIEVDFSVPETLLPRLRRGQRVKLTSAAWPDRVFEGKINRIDSRVDSATRSIAIRAGIANDDRALAGGMFLQVELVLDQREGVSIPERVLQVEGDQTLVMVAEDGVARRAAIEIGQQIDGRVELLSGLSPSAQIIVTNLHRVAPGTAVEAIPQDNPTETAAAPEGNG